MGIEEDRDLDRSLARALLRLALGLNLLVHGLVRVPALGKFADGLALDFSATIVPTPLAAALLATRSWDRWSLDARRR